MTELANNDQTFCVKPWIYLLINPDSSISYCSNLYTGPSKDSTLLYITQNDIEEFLNSKTSREIRSYLLQGKQHPKCKACWNSEKANIKSKRMSVYQCENKIFSYQDAKAITDIETGRINTDFTPFNFDLRLDNVCNLKCRSCDPMKSHLLYDDWVKLEKKDNFNYYFKNLDQNICSSNKKNYSWINQDNNLQKILEIISDATNISFAGGEPFLIKAYETILHNLIDTKRSSKINLRFETNMTLLPKTIVQLWKTFRKITLSISLDGIYKINDYIRYPSKFKTIKNNIIQLQKMKLPNLKIVFEITVSVFNIYYLPEILNYHKAKWGDNITISFHLLFYPVPYSITMLPMTIKQTISRKLQEFIATCDNIPDIKNDLIGIDNHMMQVHHAESVFLYFLEITSSLDILRKQNIFDFLPEFASLIDDYIDNR